MAKIEGGVKILLDIDKVLSRQEFETVAAVKSEETPLPPEAMPEEAEAMPEQISA